MDAMESTDMLNSEMDLAGRMDAASLAETPRPNTAPRHTPFEATRQVPRVKDETAEKIRADFEDFVER